MGIPVMSWRLKYLCKTLQAVAMVDSNARAELSSLPNGAIIVFDTAGEETSVMLLKDEKGITCHTSMAHGNMLLPHEEYTTSIHIISPSVAKQLLTCRTALATVIAKGDACIEGRLDTAAAIVHLVELSTPYLTGQAKARSLMKRYRKPKHLAGRKITIANQILLKGEKGGF